MKYFISILLPVLFAVQAFAYGPAFSNDSQTVFNVGASYEDDILETLEGSIIYSLGGVLDLGLELQTKTDEQDNFEVRYSILYSVAAVRQSNFYPFSLFVHGSYGFIQYQRQDEVVNELYQRGNLFVLGIDIVRDVRILPFLFIRGGATAVYERQEDTLLSTTIGEDPSGVVYQTQTFERNMDFFYGGYASIGFSYRDLTFIALQSRFLFNAEGLFRISPRLTFSFAKF